MVRRAPLAIGCAAGALAALWACFPRYDFAEDGEADASPDADASPADTAPREEDARGGLDLTGCVLHLAMEEAQWTGAAGEAADRCGAPNPGQALGGAATVPGGVIGRAASFDGKGCLRVDDAAELHPGAEFTVAAWVNPAGLGSDANDGTLGIVSKRRDYGSETAYAMFFYAQSRTYLDVDLEESRGASTRVFQNGQWAHLAMVYRGAAAAGARVRLYVNGALENVFAETSATIPAYTSAVWVGCLPLGNAPAQWFTGLIDEVYVFHRALSDAEIDTLAKLR